VVAHATLKDVSEYVGDGRSAAGTANVSPVLSRKIHEAILLVSRVDPRADLGRVIASELSPDLANNSPHFRR
jgi:hypothetical protein